MSDVRACASRAVWQNVPQTFLTAPRCQARNIKGTFCAGALMSNRMMSNAVMPNSLAPYEMGRDGTCAQDWDVETRRQRRIRSLKRLLTRVERRQGVFVPLDGPDADEPSAYVSGDECDVAASSPWTLGPEVAKALGPAAYLSKSAVHELKPDTGCEAENWVGARASMAGFALALAGRHLALERSRSCVGAAQVNVANDESATPRIAICTTADQRRELGRFYGPGLSKFGLSSRDLLLVETGRAADCLWALEETVRSGAFALVIGAVADVALTPARRLALAAHETGVACLLMTNATSPPAAATATRWRVAPSESGPHALISDAPGALRFSVHVERCRKAPACESGNPIVLEWCDETVCFGLAAGVRNRAPTSASCQDTGIRTVASRSTRGQLAA